MGVYIRDEKNGSNPLVVAKLVNKIINTPYPKPRYLVGNLMQKIAVILKRILPDRLWGKIMKSTYNIV
jgi:hypothetical protein